ncbi:radical SAM protein, partial [bacterium]|nr:radical SAM protein [bacterium]
RCKHCYNIDYIKSQNEDLTTEQVKKIIDKSINIGCKDIGFSGGEPFARNDIVEIIDYCKEYPIHILTNGLLISDEIIKKLNNIKNLVLEFRISLDGLTSHTFLRNVQYENTLNVIKKLLKNDYVITVNTMITDNNLNELLQMYDLLKSINVDRWRLDFVFNSGNANENGLVLTNLPKLFEVMEKLINLYISERPEMILDINKVFRSSFLKGYESFEYTLDSKPCEYQGSLTVRPNGDISFCPSMNLTFGNILTDDIDDIVKKQEWKNFANIKVEDLDDKCRNCKYMKYCGGGCRADGFYDTGNIKGISPLTCELIEFYVEKVLPLIENSKNY